MNIRCPLHLPRKRICLSRKIIWLLGLIVCLVFQGCANIPSRQGHQINQITFRNHTLADIYDVRLSVEKTRGFVVCGFIPKNTECSNKFRIRQYGSNQVKVSWREHQKNRELGPFNVTLSEAVRHDVPLQAVIEFKSNGSVNAFLEQMNIE